MKKYLVIGNPIEHSLSPRLHNYWFKENNIEAIYEKRQIKEPDIKGIISDIRNGKIEGINVTVPFKKSVIPFLDKLEIPKKTQSVNTIYIEKNNKTGSNKIIGENKAIELLADKETDRSSAYEIIRIAKQNKLKVVIKTRGSK